VRVREDYPTAVGDDGEMLFPEPWPGAWLEYSRMIESVADDGVAAGPDNMRIYSDHDTGGHMLYNPAFYDAVAGRNWCWFHYNAPTLLEDYTNFFPPWWPALPEPPRSDVGNSEIYGLRLDTTIRTLEGFGLTAEAAAALGTERGLSGVINDAGMTTDVAWVVYDGSWGSWDAAATSGEYPFPFSGPLRDTYNYAGADAAVRVEATAGRLTPGSGGASISNTITWTSAAKPFGSLEGDQSPPVYGLVLPAYTDVRLIPVDTSSAPAAGGFNLDWREHIEEHLPMYMANGPHIMPSSCYYCRQLKTWEDVGFRQAGVNWLELYSDQCRPDPRGPGGGPGGGSRRGH